MTRLAELGLNENAAPAVDWNAPEGGNQAPAVYPGIYKLQFKMPDDVAEWFDKIEAEAIKGNAASKQGWLVVCPRPYILASLVNAQGQPDKDGQEHPLPVDEQTKLPPQMPPQRVSFYKSQKMLISQGGEMLRALGVRLEGSMLGQIEATLQQLNGRVTFPAQLGWRAYFKNTDTTVSTDKRRKTELTWPRTADGTPELLAVDPKTGQKAFGYLEIVRFFQPSSNGQ